LSLYENDKMIESSPSDEPQPPKKPELDEVFLTASLTLLETVRAKSANSEIFTRELIQTLNSPSPDQNQRLLRNDKAGEDYKTDLILDLLALEGISARVVRGLFLEDGRRRQSLTNFVEIYNEQEWI